MPMVMNANFIKKIRKILSGVYYPLFFFACDLEGNSAFKKITGGQTDDYRRKNSLLGNNG